MALLKKTKTIFYVLISSMGLTTYANANQQPTTAKVENAITQAFQPLMQKYAVPGMAIGVLYQGKSYEKYYGVQSLTDKKSINKNTLFELGSVSKLFTATAGSYAQSLSKLSLQDHPGKYLPALKDSQINKVTLLQLATYTTGNLPLQFPDQVKTDAQTLKYFQDWKINRPIGQFRQYSNPSIGLFGEVTAKAMNMPFSTLLEQVIFPQLQLQHSYVNVPKSQQANYAFGYDQNNHPIRVSPGPFDAQAYGVKSSLPDLLQFLNLNLNPEQAKASVRPAIQGTHVGYFKMGEMTQALGWETFNDPASLDTLLESNSDRVVLQSNPVEKTLVQSGARVFHKTGSTNGFGTYLVYIPSEKFGLVMLMNKRIANAERIRAAYDVLNTLRQTSNP
ncbi:class C beta-lactamase [Acinetobacter nematophilus]|uniref:class C beta-lactamase n=1 Tax=Acinetobacter nematophilus TaxID=2994642 RepID=UPI003AF8DB48